MTYRDDNDEIFGRLTSDGNVRLCYVSDGTAVTRLDDTVYPVGSQLSARYEHPEGIVLSREDADRLGVEIED